MVRKVAIEKVIKLKVTALAGSRGRAPESHADSTGDYNGGRTQGSHSGQRRTRRQRRDLSRR